MSQGVSEVANLKAQISASYQAAKLALAGPAQGAAKHKFINYRTQHIGNCYEQLVNQVGPDIALELLEEAMDAN